MTELQTLALTVIVTGCAAVSSGAGSRGGPSDLITTAELEQHVDEDLFAFIQRARPVWLRTRSLLSTSGELNLIVVVLDGMPQEPGFAPLVGFRVGEVQEVRRLNARDATTRFGTNMTAGAILVATRRPLAAPAPPVRPGEAPVIESRPGDRVRLAAGATLTGVVRWLTADSISVLAAGSDEPQTFALGSLHRLDVSRGRGPRWSGVLFAGAVGGVFGFLVGSAEDRSGDPTTTRESLCAVTEGASCYSSGGAGTVAKFAAGGIALGGLFGALLTLPERWEPLITPPGRARSGRSPRESLDVGWSVRTR